MTTVLGTNSYWPSTASNTNANNQPTTRQQSKLELNGNDSSSSLTAFNFDDSGVGTEDHHTITATNMAIDSDPSPPFYTQHTFPPQHQNFNQMVVCFFNTYDICYS